MSSTLIDHVYTNYPDKYGSISTYDAFGSDHKLICAVRRKDKVKLQQNVINVRSIRNIEPEKFRKSLLDLNWNCLKNVKVSNEVLDIFTNVVMAVVNSYAPLKKRVVKSVQCPWYNSEVKKICSIRDNVQRRCNKTLDEFEKANFYEMYKSARNKANNVKERVKKLFYRKKFSNCKTSEGIWSVMNSLINYKNVKCTTISKLLKSDGKSTESNEEICDRLANEFRLKSSECDPMQLEKLTRRM